MKMQISFEIESMKKKLSFEIEKELERKTCFLWDGIKKPIPSLEVNKFSKFKKQFQIQFSKSERN